MAEVEQSQVEEIGDQDDLTRPEMTSNPAHDEAELTKIVENEVATHIGTAVQVGCIGAP